ncbi:DHH family phosphoesterase [bacterium]|nr:DHH family phosphoesterase [bacterium]
MKIDFDAEWRAVIDFIKANDDFLVTSHFSPDGDAVCSVLAMGEILERFDKKRTLAIEGGVPLKYGFLPGSPTVINPENIEISRRYSNLVVLDVGSFKRIGRIKDMISDNPRIINIDHHASENHFGEISIIDSAASSVCEMLYRFIEITDIELTPQLAAVLYTGIMTDTGRFRFNNTTPKVFGICAELVKAGAVPEKISHEVYYNLPKDYMEALAKTLSSLTFHREGVVAVMEYLDSKEIEDSEGIINYAISIRDVRVAVFIRISEDGRLKVSLRSQNSFDVKQIAESFGGGGHQQAAGFRYRGKLDDLKNALLKTIDEHLSEK